MTDVRKDVEALREALDAGPTPGPWFFGEGMRNKVARVASLSVYADVEPEDAEWPDAAFIAACYPDRIERILAALADAEQRARDFMAIADLQKTVIDTAEEMRRAAEQRAEAAEARVRDLLGQREEGREKLAAYRDMVDDCTARLHARAEAAEADARRYRWLESKAIKRTAYDVYGNGCNWSVGFVADDSSLGFGAAVDAHLSKEASRT